MSEKVESMLTIFAARATSARRWRIVCAVTTDPRFGHRLYANGDPRAALLMEMLAKRFGKSPEVVFARNVAKAGEELTGDKPTIDFALVAVARGAQTRRGAPLTLFALGAASDGSATPSSSNAKDDMIRPRARTWGSAETVVRSGNAV